MSPADAWQRPGLPDRSNPSGPVARFDRNRDREEYVPRSPRSAPPPPRSRSAAGDRARADRMRSPERQPPRDRQHPRDSYAGGDDEYEYRRPPAGRRPEPSGARPDPDMAAERRSSEPRGGSGRPRRDQLRQEDSGRSRLRGAVAVLAVFLLTLAACGVESFLASGLGIVTTVVLVLSAAAATLLVRRRDLVSVVVAPPLIYVAVAAIDVAAAPSATFSLTTLATLLIRGFPTMGIATGVALVMALIRWAARR